MNMVRTIGGKVARSLGYQRPTAPPKPESSHDVTRRQFANLQPLAIRRTDTGTPSICMVTDTVSRGYLFGGVGTAILLAATLASRRGMQLRIVTRAHDSEEAPIRDLLRLHGVTYVGPLDLIKSESSEDVAVPLRRDDVVLTTSWWTTYATLSSVEPDQIRYLVQEDERLFYVGGDQHLLCSETLCDNRIGRFVNTLLLLQHFEMLEGAHFSNAVSFEPAFPRSIYYPEPLGGRRRLMYYARPNHPRNLFIRGLQALESALKEGLFPEQDWEIHLFGVDIIPVQLDGRQVKYHDTLLWADYAALIRSCDLALSLMYTPHPSYPPLDLAASGAVVVTNRYGIKYDLSDLCANILTAPLTTTGLVQALRQGSKLALDDKRRRDNFDRARFCRDWSESFEPIIRTFA